MTQYERLYQSISLLSWLNAFWVKKLGFWQKTSTFFKFLISFISMSTNTESIYAMYLHHVRVLFSWLGAFFVKNLAFRRKSLTFFNFLNYWISVISFAAYVVYRVLRQLIRFCSQQISFLGEKNVFLLQKV